MAISVFWKQTNEQEFFSALYHKHKKLLYYLARNLLSSQEDIQDVVQDALEALLKHRDKLMSLSEEAQTGYIAQTVRTTAIDYLRRNRRIADNETDLGEEDYMDLSSPLSSADHLDDRLLIQSVLSSLSVTDAQVLRYRYFLDYRDSEIAQAMGVSPGSVRMMLTRARRNAQQVLKQMEDSP